MAALTSFLLAAVVAEREAIGEDLRASRARLVEASDTERRKLVRDLHDGAQQRLSALAVHLRLAADDAPPPQQTAALIVRAGDELTLAIEELRELAHGLPPALLSKLGLAGAIRSIAARASTPVTLVALPSVRLDDTAEATAYYVIAEAVTNAQRYSHASSIRISAVVSPHRHRHRRGRRRRRRRERGDELRAPGPARPRRGDRRHVRAGEPAGPGHARLGGDPGDGRGPHRQWMRALMAISTPPMVATASACTTQASGRAPASRPAA